MRFQQCLPPVVFDWLFPPCISPQRYHFNTGIMHCPFSRVDFGRFTCFLSWRGRRDICCNWHWFCFCLTPFPGGNPRVIEQSFSKVPCILSFAFFFLALAWVDLVSIVFHVLEGRTSNCVPSPCRHPWISCVLIGPSTRPFLSGPSVKTTLEPRSLKGKGTD